MYGYILHKRLNDRPPAAAFPYIMHFAFDMFTRHHPNRHSEGERESGRCTHMPNAGNHLLNDFATYTTKVFKSVRFAAGIQRF